MSKTAIVAVSKNGSVLGSKLKQAYRDQADLYVDNRFCEYASDYISYNLPLRPIISRVFHSYDIIILFLPVGASVRLIAPYLKTKSVDPAVICVDEMGKFAVSLVSGHVGGADKATQQVADVIGSIPVITSASHVLESLSIDLLGKESGWVLASDSVMITRASAMIINGGSIGIYQDSGQRDWVMGLESLANIVNQHDDLEALLADCVDVRLVVTDLNVERACKAASQDGKNIVVYHPKSLVVGMGCRRGVSVDKLNELLTDSFEEVGLSLSSILAFATAEIKQNEPGLIELSEKYGVPLYTYSVEALNNVFSKESDSKWDFQLDRSEKAHNLLGVWGVSEPSSILAADSVDLVMSKRRSDCATVAVTRIKEN